MFNRLRIPSKIHIYTHIQRLTIFQNKHKKGWNIGVKGFDTKSFISIFRLCLHKKKKGNFATPKNNLSEDTCC